jgi:hypothetical protein
MLTLIHKPFCAECRYAECRYAECRYAECRRADESTSIYTDVSITALESFIVQALVSNKLAHNEKHKVLLSLPCLLPK